MARDNFYSSGLRHAVRRATRNFVGSERPDTRGDSRAGLSRPRRAQDPDQTLDSNIRNLCVEFKFFQA